MPPLAGEAPPTPSAPSDASGPARRTLLLGGVVSGLLTALLGLLLPKPALLQAYIHVAPTFAAAELIALFGCLLLALLGLRGQQRRWREHLVDGALSCLLVTTIAAVVPASLRVQGDESNLAATSFGLLHTWTPEASLAGIYDAQGILHPEFVSLDKRGLLFPELLLPIHASRGFDPLNGARLNLVSGALALWLLISLAGTALGPKVGRGSAVLLAATPAFAIAVRSGGFDVSNLAALLATIVALVQLRRRPGALLAWVVMLCAAVLAQLRYESALPAAAAMVMVGMLALDRSVPAAAARALALPALCGPLLLLPALWRHAVPNDLEMVSSAIAPFSFANAEHNLAGFLAWLFTPDPARLGLPALGGLLVLAMLQAGWRLARGQRPAVVPRPWLPMCAALGLMFFITISYWWSQALVAGTVRLFLPWLALVCVIAANALVATGPRLGSWLSTLVPVLAILWRLPIAAQGLDLVQMRTELRIEAIEKELNEDMPGCRTLVLDNRPGAFVVRGWSGLPPLAAAEHWDTLATLADRYSLDRIITTAPPSTLPFPAALDLVWSPSKARYLGWPLFWRLDSANPTACRGDRPSPAGIDSVSFRKAGRPALSY